MTPEEKASVERVALDAHNRRDKGGFVPLKACPYPDGSEQATHWLAWVLFLGAVVR